MHPGPACCQELLYGAAHLPPGLDPAGPADGGLNALSAVPALDGGLSYPSAGNLGHSSSRCTRGSLGESLCQVSLRG